MKHIVVTISKTFISYLEQILYPHEMNDAVVCKVLVHDEQRRDDTRDTALEWVFSDAKKLAVHLTASTDRVEQIVSAAQEMCRTARHGTISIVIADSGLHANFNF